MALLPNHEQAFIAIEKLKDYSLDPLHPTGKDKAIVFKSVLGLTDQDAGFLGEAILKALPKGEAVPGREDQYGKRYLVDIKIHNLDKEVIVRTGWIIKKNEDFPRLTTCYVK